MIEVDKSLASRKQDLLSYFRARADESAADVRLSVGSSEVRAQATAINRAATESALQLTKTVLSKAVEEGWNNQELLENLLMITYTSYVVMIDFRNEVWPYDYMTFSRRMGELWQPFCKLCFDYPVRSLRLIVPPLFSDVRRRLANEIDEYIDGLNISDTQKADLRHYYEKVWSLVTSGEIKLELDLHFEQDGQKYIVDFKSGFGSNEKGNTNRLLLVATIYRNLEENYRCLLWVRAEEDRNNAYFRILQNSGVWEAFCGEATYDQMREHSGFDLKSWIQTNVDWMTDLKPETSQHLRDMKLEDYAKW